MDLRPLFLDLLEPGDLGLFIEVKLETDLCSDPISLSPSKLPSTFREFFESFFTTITLEVLLRLLDLGLQELDTLSLEELLDSS